MIINRIHTILAPTATNPSSIHRVETDTSGVMIRMKDESGVSWFTPSDLACLLFESRFEQTIAAMPQDEPSLSEAPAPTECSKAPIPVHEEDCTNNDLMEKLELILSSQTSLGQQMQTLIGRVGAVFKPEPSRRESSSLPPHLTSLLSYFGLPAPSAPAQPAKSSLEALLSVLVADDREEPKDGPTPGCDCPRCQALRAFASGDDQYR
jgi:hypothetical protein